MNIPRLMAAALIAAAASAQQSVDTVRVVSKTVERKLTLPGELAPYLAVDMYARVSGFVDQVNVDRGSIVKKGQLLVTVVAPELTAQVAEAENKAQAAASDRAEAQAKLVASQSTYERTKAAAATPGAVAENEVIVAEKQMESAKALVDAKESANRAAQAALASLRDLQSYLNVTAPFDGVITTRFVHPGALAGPAAGASATPMLRLEDDARLRLVVAVPEADAGGIPRGARVTFTVPAYPGESFEGLVSRVAHSLDLKTRTMPVELDVANPGLKLAPGMYAQVQWPVRSPRAAVLVPASSIVTTNERQFVERISGGLVEWVTVKRGAPAAADLVEVFGPLRAGDVIARRGTDELREGTRVQVRE